MWAIALSSWTTGGCCRSPGTVRFLGADEHGKQNAAIDPPAMSPELNSVPAPSSDSSFTPLLRSTYQRTSPPAKIGAVVATGRYAPTANDSEWMPHSSSVTGEEDADEDEPHGRF